MRIQGRRISDFLRTKENGANRFWWWSRFCIWAYHTTHGTDTSVRGIDHMNHCDYCRRRFERWLKKQGKAKA